MSVPLFSDFGKGLSDLLTKNYFKGPGGFELSSKRVSDELTLESKVGVAPAKDGSVQPTSGLKATYKVAKVGEIEADLNVNGKAKATFKANKLVDNLTLKVGANTLENDKDLLAEFRTAKKDAKYQQQAFVTVQADYAIQKNVAASATVNTNGSGAFVDASLSAGQDGVAIGGAVKLAVSKKDALKDGADSPADVETLLDYSAGVQYSTAAYTVGVNALSKGNKFAFGYTQNVAKDYTLGSSFEWDTVSNLSVMTLGSSYKPSSDVLLKAKAEIGKKAKKADVLDVFTVTALAERKFANPQLKIGATLEFDATKSLTKPVWYGVSVSLGDF